MVRPEEWNRSDGFSPGQELITRVPGLDTQQAFDNSGIVPETDIERSFAPDRSCDPALFAVGGG